MAAATVPHINDRGELIVPENLTAYFVRHSDGVGLFRVRLAAGVLIAGSTPEFVLGHTDGLLVRSDAANVVRISREPATASAIDAYARALELAQAELGRANATIAELQARLRDITGQRVGPVMDGSE